MDDNQCYLPYKYKYSLLILEQFAKMLLDSFTASVYLLT